MHQALRGPAKQTRMFAWCPLFPLYFCFISHDVLQQESRPHGPPLFPSTGHRRSFFLPSSTLFILSFSWAWIFVSVLGNLPPSNSVRHGACFVLSQKATRLLEASGFSMLSRDPTALFRSTRHTSLHRVSHKL